MEGGGGEESMSMLPGERVQKTFSGLIKALLEVGCREAALTEPTGLQSLKILLLNVHPMVQGFNWVIQPGLSVCSQVMLSLGYHQDSSNEGFISVIYFSPTEIALFI